MSAQTAYEPSMEEILASIRKIISEDSKEDPASADEQDVPVAAAPSLSVPQESAVSAPVNSPIAAPRENPLLQPSAIQSEAQSPAPAPIPAPIVERREILSENFATPEVRQDIAPTDSIGFRPTVDDAIAATVATPAPETNSVSLAPEGFVAEHRPIPSKPATIPVEITATEIVNARLQSDSARMFDGASQIAEPAPAAHIPAASIPVEKPVFSGAAQPVVDSSVKSAMESLISPDSLERREESERRNHPLRRGADQSDQEFKTALMSPQTDDVVMSAFEQLKNSATDNLDGKVEALLRPMLREWLDNNLPSMVERLVRDEIERVSRGE